MEEDDLIDYLEGFPMGVVVRMLEEQEEQGNDPDVKVFQDDLYMDVYDGGFDWSKTEAGLRFWISVIFDKEWDIFFKRYPKYRDYNLY